MQKEKMLTKILLGFFIGAAGCIAITFALDEYLVAELRSKGADVVPYGSALGAPIFYSGILGALAVVMVDFVFKNQYINASSTGIVGGMIVGGINFMVWKGSSYPPFHYSNVIIFLPVIAVSGLIIFTGVVLNFPFFSCRIRGTSHYNSEHNPLQ